MKKTEASKKLASSGASKATKTAAATALAGKRASGKK